MPRSPAGPVRALRQADVLALQRTLGNRAVGRMLAARLPRLELRRQPEEAPAEPAGGPLSEEEVALFESLLDETTDEELARGWEALDREDETGAAGLIQRTRSLLASATSPDLGLAGILEANSSRSPRLVRLSQWQRIRKKHKRRGRRKYAAIRHRNLTDDLGREDLVLLIRLRRSAKIGRSRDRHYAAIESKSYNQRQTAQTRTELLGEVAASLRMEGYLGGDAKLLVGYQSGAGIDQLWVSHSASTYYVVEAKGPGAKLTVNRFAVRGAGRGGSLTQMSQQWVADRIPRLATSNSTALNQLLRDCGLRVRRGVLEDDPNVNGTHSLRGLVITARWDETTGDVNTSVKNKSYAF